MTDYRPKRSDSLRKTYGFDEISLSPSSKRTIDPSICDISSRLGKNILKTPVIASAMDGVVSPKSAVEMSKWGILPVLNLHGLWGRYEDADDKLKEISDAKDTDFVLLMQKLYSAPVKDELIARRVSEMKAAGAVVAVSSIPSDARRLSRLLTEAGAEYLFVQSTVTSLEHIGHGESLDIAKLCAENNNGLTIVVGNCVTFNVALELARTGVDGILAGIGPGAACTSRGVLGIGVPMATTIMDCAEARDFYEQETGKRVSIIADGGIINSGDVCKSIACGGDFVMLGSLFAKADEAPGNGYHWGMATPSPVLPRGTRVHVGRIGSYEKIMNGPASVDNGYHNMTGALKTSMGTLGARNLREMQHVDVIIAQSILTEGKAYQSAQKLGMGNRK